MLWLFILPVAVAPPPPLPNASDSLSRFPFPYTVPGTPAKNTAKIRNYTKTKQ